MSAPDGLLLPPGAVPPDPRSSQHIARFINVTTVVQVYSYGRRLPGLRLTASLPKELTDPRNLPAPGRRQALYVLFTSSQSPVFLVNSRYPQVTATPASSRSKSLHHPGRTFSLSYGAILPSSLTRVLSSALGSSPHLPVSVYGTVTNMTPYEDFLGSVGSPTL